MDQSVCVEPRFIKIEEKQHLLALAARIKQHLPYSSTIYNNLLVHGRGLASHHYFYILKNSPDSLIIIRQRNDRPHVTSLFCREDEVQLATEALKSTTAIDLQNRVFSYINAPYLVDPVREVVENQGEGGATRLQSRQLNTFLYHLHLDQQPLKCNAGFKICRLGKAGVCQALEASEHTKTVSVDIMYQFSRKMPSFVGAYLDSTVSQDTVVDLDNIPFAGDEDLPVSWVVSSIFGTLGMLGTLEQYRKQGLASLVATVAARLEIQQGFVPHANAEYSNIASNSLFMKTAGWVNTHTTTILLTPTD